MYLSKILAAVIILCVLFSSGCAALKAAPNPPRPKKVAQADPKYLVDPQTLAAYSTETDENKKKNIRNEMIDERILEIDHQFNEYEMELWRQGIGFGIGTDWIELALSGLTATVGGAATKAALGAAQAGIVGAKASVDKQAFMEKTLPALMAQMVAERESVRATILQNMQLPVSQYSIYAAMDDIRRFIWAGTIPGSIQSIAKDAGKKAAQADNDIKNLRELTELSPEEEDARAKFQNIWKQIYTSMQNTGQVPNVDKIRSALQFLGITPADKDTDVAKQLHRLKQRNEKTAIEIINALKQANYPGL